MVRNITIEQQLQEAYNKVKESRYLSYGNDGQVSSPITILPPLIKKPKRKRLIRKYYK